MIVRKTAIAALASIAMFVSSFGISNNHNLLDGLDHATETAVSSTETQKANRNENGELIDAEGNIITGCPGHKEMIGSQGDMCPKCEYMTMIPITWDIDGVDTVRVTSLPDYNPPADKLKK